MMDDVDEQEHLLSPIPHRDTVFKVMSERRTVHCDLSLKNFRSFLNDELAPPPTKCTLLNV